jgi:hypothetical protein
MTMLVATQNRPLCVAFLEWEPGPRIERMLGNGRRLPVAMDRIVEAAPATALVDHPDELALPPDWICLGQ